MYPEQAQLLNLKNIDKVVGMELWYQFMKTEPYPDWFWSKSKKEKSVLTDKDFKLLMDKLNIKDIDVEYLVDKHYDFIKEELKYYKSLEKQK